MDAIVGQHITWDIVRWEAHPRPTVARAIQGGIDAWVSHIRIEYEAIAIFDGFVVHLRLARSTGRGAIHPLIRWSRTAVRNTVCRVCELADCPVNLGVHCFAPQGR